ncbi:MAG: phenylalanine--tRNA ligase subunit beta [Dehalococcoidia bacterium]|nr:phenylalanine--tRNA ligase subunit beta [Dehalococcoidia bacterium]
MKCSLKWLKKYVDIDGIAPEALAKRITQAGTEVARIEIIGGWNNVYIGRIAAVNPHPNADRLRLATVELGSEQATVVCGAPNLVTGDKIAFAKAGANLIDGHTGEKTTLKPSKIRGVLSDGMICSEMELGLSRNHDGILVLPDDAPLGGLVADYLGDIIFDLEVTPNRPDMLSMLGIAREAAALTGNSAHEPDLGYTEAGEPIEKRVSVEIQNTELCPRYCAALVTGVKIGPSPGWLKEAVNSAGIRSINNVVDIANFVMMEYGQPLHTFDYDKISGAAINVRCATEGETLKTLDGAEHRLSSDTLVIADPRGAIAVAGVMGGASTEVTEATTAILLESASFKASSIHNTRMRLKLPSEASYRFERGIRADLALPAARRAVQLMVEICGGDAAAGIIDVYPGRKEPKSLVITAAEVKRILGIEVAAEEIEKHLTAVSCHVEKQSDTAFAVTAPYWRSDLRIEADFIEEIARVMGYEHIPDRPLSGALPMQNPDPRLGLRLKLRQTLSGFGFSEIVTCALTDKQSLEKGLNAPLSIEPLRVRHPMSADQEFLRTSLRGGVLAALTANVRREDGVIAMFEAGRVYLPKAGELPDEPEMLCGALTSTGASRTWLDRKEPVDFFDAKGVMEGLLAALEIRADYAESSDAGLRAGRRAEVKIGSAVAGVLGEIHPEAARAFELPPNTYLFEISIDALMNARAGGRYEPLPKFPAVTRDLALVLDESVTHAQVLEIIRGFPMVKTAALFDVYSGRQLGDGKKSLAYSLSFQSPDHTLTDAEADKVFAAILQKLEASLGAALRGTG